MDVRTIADALRAHAESSPDRPAVVATGCPTLSYGQLFHTIGRLRSDLRQAGLGPGARVVVAVPSGPVAAVTVVAVACCATAVPLDTKLAPPEVDKALGLLRPAAVVLRAGDDLPARTIAARRGLPVIEIGVPENGSLDLSLTVPRIGSAPALQEPDGDNPAFILHTSGTTGEPKLIPYSHRNMLAAAARVQGWFGLTQADRCLSVSPVHYCHGLTVTVFAPLITGGSVAFPRDPSRLDFAEWFGELGPTWYSAGPTLHRYLLEKAQLLPDPRRSLALRFAVSGGAPLSQDVSAGLTRALGIPVLDHYGASEAGQISANLPPPGPAKQGTCGIPPESTLMIARDDGTQARAGERGEVWVRGPTLTSGYLDAPEINRAAFVDGWFRTGDIGSLDDEGFLTLHGRKKELINRGGEKISPTEIDEALLRHPAVKEAAAYAVPHPRLGEDVAAAVVLKPGAAVMQEDLRAFLGTQLAWFKVPRRIVLHDRLPTGPTGKVQRQKLGSS